MKLAMCIAHVSETIGFQHHTPRLFMDTTVVYKCLADLETDTTMSSPLCRYEHHYQSALFHENRKTQHQKQFDASDDLSVKNNLALEIKQDSMLIKESQAALCCRFFSQEKHKLFPQQNKGMWMGKQLELKLSSSEDIAQARQARANAQAVSDNKAKKRTSTAEAESNTERVNKHRSRVSKSLF